ncbi:hypothetical protein LZ30DRAFT_597235, partial [Colletotrichum cereale]
QVFSVVLSAIWGTLSINSLKTLGASDRLEENDWTFGQVMSLALLLSSLLPIFDLLSKSLFRGRNQREITTQASPLVCQSRQYSLPFKSLYLKQLS